MAGLFSGIEKASYSEGGVYLLPGNYILEVMELKSGTSRQKVDFFVAECRVLQSTNSDRRPGTIVSYWVGLKVDTPALSDVRRFIAVCGECEDTDVDATAAEMAVSDEQPFKGRVLRAAATNIITAKAKRDFTKVVWSNYEGSEADVIALKKAAGL